MKTDYQKRYCGQIVKVNKDVADRNQDELMGRRRTQGKWVVQNWQADAQARGRWRHLFEEAKAPSQGCRADDDTFQHYRVILRQTVINNFANLHKYFKCSCW